MLLRNDLLEYTAPRPRTVRILWIDADQGRAWLFELNAKGAAPELATLASLVADVQAQRARLRLIDPYAPLPDAAALPAKYREVQARAWEVVSTLCAQEPAIYQARLRGRMVADYSALHGVSHPTIYRYLRRYWERGQTPAALLPDYGNSGARGKTRASSANVKRGRPRKSGLGLNADAAIRATFHAAVARYAATHAQFSRRGAYRQMIEDYFAAREADAQPSFGQFNYWIEKDGA